VTALASPPIVELRGVVKRYGDKLVLPGIDLSVADGEFLTLLGPSGCGKTTILRLLAGFEEAQAGEIYIDGRRVDGLSANERPVNTVFQHYALFPHMTVFDNIAFGLAMKKVARGEIATRVGEALEMVRLSEYAQRKPNQLSGGQQQRVALARAVVNRPRLLLLDECLNALDNKLRQQMRIELKQLQRQLGIAFLFVTHDQEEALSMSDRIAVMREGYIEQLGTPRQLYEQPQNLFVASFVGDVNVFAGEVVGPLGDGWEVLVEGLSCRVQAEGLVAGGRAKILLRPEDMRLEDLAADAQPAAGQLVGRIVERVYKGKTLDSIVELESGLRVAASEFFDEESPDFDYAPGSRVSVSWVPGWEVALVDD
jgi:spermidine/putrescine transport system ATP-binding protein